MELIDRLLEHDRWGTTQLLEVSRTLTDEQLDQPFDIGHQTLRETFQHMIYNTSFWTGLMLGQPFEPERELPGYDRSLAALSDWHDQSQATLAAFARRVCEEQRLEETFTDHFDGQLTFGGAILHVILHNDEHRTEVLHILGRLGVADLPEVDHALWDYKRRGF